MKHYLEILKNLTPEQCVDIAKIACPGYEWGYFIPNVENLIWHGHDVVTKTIVNGIPLRTFQIDYGNTSSNFRFYNEGLFKIPIEGSMLEIFQYLADLQSKETEKPMKPIENKGEISDGYHTFNELYAFRLQYNAAFFNQLALNDDYRNYQVHKSKKHSDGTPCFDGTYFIVSAKLPTGQISNHYEIEYWDTFSVPEKPQALFEYDGHTSEDVLARLKDMNDGYNRGCMRRFDTKKDTTHNDNIAEFLNILQNDIELLAEDRKRYGMCLLAGEFDGKKEKKKTKKEYKIIISKLEVLYDLKTSYLSIFSKEIK